MTAKIVYDMPFEDYLAVEALSFSGICWLMQSPLDFWTRCPWLCPQPLVEESPAMANGKALHTRVIEGPDVFAERYAPEFEADDDHLHTVDEIKGCLRGHSQLLTGKKADLIQRLLHVMPEAKIYDVDKERYKSKHEGKTLLPAEQISEIEYAAGMIEKHPQLSKAFTGGHPEVSVFWNMDGVPMKCRIDYLKPGAVVEYKTFTNKRKMPAAKAVNMAIANERYHLQAVIYQTALEAAGEPERKWLWVFQQQGPVPIAVGRLFERQTLYGVGQAQLSDMVALYKSCLSTFGELPWVDNTPIETLDDLQVPAWASD